MLNFTQFQQNLNEDATATKAMPELGSSSEPGISIHGIHYSHAGRDFLSGAYSGTGIRGEESARLSQTTDHRIKKRVYFYNKQPGRLPQPEQGLGSHVHSAMVHGIFDPQTAKDEDRERIRQHKQKYLIKPGMHPSNAFESALVDAGFRGYTNRGMTVVLNHTHIPVKHEGLKHEIKG